MITKINNLICDRDWENKKVIINSFPRSLKSDAEKVSSLLMYDKYPIESKIEVVVNNEYYRIPYRVHFKKLPFWKLWNLSNIQKIMIWCIFSRHHDGYIREEMLRKLIWINLDFTIPYILQPLNEYVIELLPIVNTLINNDNLESYHKFYKENQSYFKKMESRIMSYWEVYYWYYRGCKKSDYIWFQITNKIKFYWTNKS